jgi:hypothetical protein
LWRRPRHRRRRRECSKEQQCRGAAPDVEPGPTPENPLRSPFAP